MSVVISRRDIQITLPNPQLNDTKTLNLSIDKHTMMDGTIYTYRRLGDYIELVYDFENVPATKMHGLLLLLITDINKDITLVNHEGDTYEGKINTDELKAEYLGRAVGNQKETGSFTLAFKGIKQ